MEIRPQHHLDFFSSLVESRICYIEPRLHDISEYGMALKVCQLFMEIIWGVRHLTEMKNSGLPLSFRFHVLQEEYNSQNLSLVFCLLAKRTDQRCREDDPFIINSLSSLLQHSLPCSCIKMVCNLINLLIFRAFSSFPIVCFCLWYWI